MLREFVTNPVIIGLVAGTICYTYLYWNRQTQNEKRLKKGKKNIDNYDDIIIPTIVSVLVWFIAIGYINYKKTPCTTLYQPPMSRNIVDVLHEPSYRDFVQTQMPLPTMNPAYKLVVDQPSDIHNSFTLVKSGITLPLSGPPYELLPHQTQSQLPHANLINPTNIGVPDIFIN